MENQVDSVSALLRGHTTLLFQKLRGVFVLLHWEGIVLAHVLADLSEWRSNGLIAAISAELAIASA